jgi:RHS repeat-associated protein
MGCLKLSYYPTTELKIISSKKVLTFIKIENNSRRNYLYGFQGKEGDNEVKGQGNSYDFGARIYDPRLGRFLSTDPLQKKYPDLSPYHFSGNNPILFVDYDGKDFGVKIDHDAKTIVIVANIYTTSKTAYDQALKSAGAWNAKSATVDGYTVTFQVKVMEASKSPMTDEEIIKANPSLVNKRGKVNNEKLQSYKNKLVNNAAWADASADDIGNVYAGTQGHNSKNVSGESYVGGVTENGKHISMNTHDESGDMGAYPDLVTHEEGHLFGLDDEGGTYFSGDGIMKYKGTSLNPISDNDVKDILKFTKDALGGKTKDTDPKVKLLEQKGKSDGSNPIGVKSE